MDASQKRTLAIGAGAVVALGAVAYLARKSRAGREDALAKELAAMKAALAAAEAKLQAQRAVAPAPAAAAPAAASAVSAAPAAVAPAPAAAAAAGGAPKKLRRVYIDGCFDLMHYGHSNAIRQAKACGDVLVVGLIADAEIIKYKGTPPVMKEEERFAALEACKWADEIIRDAPYELTEEWVNKLVAEYGVDAVVHGDDPCLTPDGKDAYAYAKSIGVYQQVKRTEGVSTTDIVGRMLLMTRDHHLPPPEADAGVGAAAGGGDGSGAGAGTPIRSTRSLRSSSLSLQDLAADLERAEGDGVGAGAPKRTARMSALLSALPSAHSKFLPTARRIMQFAEGKVPRPDDVVVYITGSWDMFSAGHVAALQEARKLGTFLLVGIHDDATVNKMRGKGLPILNLYERALSLLSCKYVDEVILGAPWVISEELIKTMNISLVARGSVSDMENAEAHSALGLPHSPPLVAEALDQAYAVPAKLGILRVFTSPRPSLTALSIVERILAQREAFQRRYEKKSGMEKAYEAAKTYVQEA